MTRTPWIIVGVASLGLGLTACGTPTRVGSAPTTATNAIPRSTIAVGLSVESSPYGKILANGAGRTLYSLSTDTSARVTCIGNCVQVWTPYTVTALPVFGAGISRGLLGDAMRASGSHQLTYGGHPLYTFTGDTAAHQTHGEGIKSFGGIWSVLSASTGKPVSATTGSSSGGYY